MLEIKMSELKSLFLEKLHINNGARMGGFAGYNMPIQYQNGLMKEHLHTREAVSIFDVSHMGQIHISGKDNTNFLDRVLPIPSASLKVGRARYTVMLNERGGIIDDLIITRKSEDVFWVVLNAACMEKDMKHLSDVAKSFPNVQIDILDDRCLCAIQGPQAIKKVAGLANASGEASVEDLKFMSGFEMKFQGIPLWANRSGYTGEDGLELSIPHSIAEELIETLLQDKEIKLAGLGARNSLRLEAGLSLYGNDMDENTNVYEANLGFAISKLRLENTNGIDFIGAEVTRKAKNETPKRMRVGVQPSGKAPMREHVELFGSENGSKKVGEICSGGFSPTLGVPIAFAYVEQGYNDIGQKIFANLRGKFVETTVCELPFVAHRYKR